MSTGYEPLAGGAALQKQLDAMVDRASDWEPAFGAVIESFHAIEKARFNANGPGWLPLAEATISMTGSWARTNQNFDEILQDTGVLMASITSEVCGVSKTTVRVFSPNGPVPSRVFEARGATVTALARTVCVAELLGVSLSTQRAKLTRAS